MRTVDIGEAARSLSEYGRRERSETWVLTRRGKPVAAVVPLDDEDYFSMRVANSPEFIEIIESSRASARAHGTIPVEDVEKELGIEPPKQRQPASAGRGPRSR